MLETVILSVSVVLQFAAALLALRLIRVTGRRAAWSMLALAVSLMAVRRFVTLLDATADGWYTPNLPAELVALGTSILMLLGIGLIGPVFRSIAKSAAVEQRHQELQSRFQTQRKSSEEQLQDAERKMGTLLSNLPGMVYRCQTDEKWTMEFVSDGCRELTGYAPDDFLQGQVALGELIDPSDRQIVWDKVQAAVRERRHFELTYQLRTASGENCWVSERGVGVYGDQGELLALEGVILDVTERQRAEARISVLAKFPSENPNPVMRVDHEGKLMYFNQRAKRLAATWISENGPQLPQQLLAPLGQAVQTQKNVQYEGDFARRTYTLTFAPIEGADYVNIYGMDITERKRAEDALRTTEAQLRQAQKMEAVGRLAGGVAHDFNNMLTVVSGYSDMMLEDLDPGDSKYEMLQVIKDAANRAAALTQQLLIFSRKEAVQPRRIGLNNTIGGMQKMLGRLIGEDIELTTTLSSSLGKVVADPTYIEQVIMNLAVNARDAMPQGGKLLIETQNVDLDGSYVDAHWGAREGAYVMLAISDTGCGMDRETQARIFEPFFTTKEEGKGTGLGLSTVYGIVKQCGGHIGVYSEPGHGTTLKIYLPRVEEQSLAEEALDDQDSIEGGQETVLLVEDNDQVRQVASRTLSQAGYVLLEAATGEDALSIALDHEEPIDLLVTDVVMPQISGPELAERLSLILPNLKVLYVSGYTDDAILRHGVLHGESNFLQKPFSAQGLKQKVRTILDRAEVVC